MCRKPLAGTVSHLAMLTFLIPLFPPAPCGAAQELHEKESAGLALVLVNITTEMMGSGKRILIEGRVLQDYQPKIIQVFPATGVVMDDRNHVLAYLGYRWVDMQRQNARIEILTAQGERRRGELIGIDQNLGLAIVRAMGARLEKTPICARCEVRDGTLVVTPLFRESGFAQFESAPVLGVGQAREAAGEGVWTLRVSRPLTGSGEPLLDARNRVLGFVAGQLPIKGEAEGVSAIVYPMSQILSSAEKILKTGGDVRTGWLGVYINDAPRSSPGIPIDRVEESGPAHKAGLQAGDIVLRYGGREIKGARQFIQMVQDSPVGSRMPIQVMREGRTLDLKAFIEARRLPKRGGAFAFSFPDVLRLTSSDEGFQVAHWVELDPWAGAEAIPLTAQMASFLEMPGQSGVLVVSVSPQQAFAEAGIQAGDVIVSVDDRRVESPQTLMQYVKSRAGKAQVAFRILRRGTERIARIQLPFLTPRTNPSADPPKPE